MLGRLQHASLKEHSLGVGKIANVEQWGAHDSPRDIHLKSRTSQVEHQGTRDVPLHNRPTNLYSARFALVMPGQSCERDFTASSVSFSHSLRFPQMSDHGSDRLNCSLSLSGGGNISCGKRV